ncbi:MAG: beta-methylgalactoside transporter [Ruminococcaceae bacterium]|nr:beta-methylgalactoside transporter [Oscillospiraceae bacterium]
MEKTKKLSFKSIYDFLINYSIFIGIVVLVIYTWINNPLFLKNAPLDLLKRTAAYVVMALGMGCIMLIGGVDLSAGRIMGLTSLIAASLLQRLDALNRQFPGMEPWPIICVLLLVIAVGIIIGSFNGFLTAKFKIHPFIVTLCTQLMLYGVMLIYFELGTYKSSSIAHLNSEYKGMIINTVKIGNWAIPNFVWYSIIIGLLVWIIWKYTGFGKKVRLYGENHEAAKTLNINPLSLTVAVFAIAGMLYGFNGFVEPARVGGSGASAGANAELDAIAACLIGGVSFKGGVGKVGGIVIGVVLVQLISVCLQWLSISANIVYIIKGGLILWATVIDARRYYSDSGVNIWKW